MPVVNLELWDIPGGLEKKLEDVYFEDVDGFIFVFDVANAKNSTQALEGWFDRVRAYEDRKKLAPLPKIKFRNKRDLIHGVLWHHYDTSKVGQCNVCTILLFLIFLGLRATWSLCTYPLCACPNLNFCRLV